MPLGLERFQRRVSLRLRRPSGRQRVQMLVAYGVKRECPWLQNPEPLIAFRIPAGGQTLPNAGAEPTVLPQSIMERRTQLQFRRSGVNRQATGRGP